MSQPPHLAAEAAQAYIKQLSQEFALDPNIASLAQFDKIMAGRKAQVDAYMAARPAPTEAQRQQHAVEKRISSFFAADKEEPSATDESELQAKFDALMSTMARDKIQEIANQRFEARDKEIQTKEGRAKWDRYEKEHGCIGAFDAHKDLMIQRALSEKLDIGALAKLAEEERAKAGAAATTTAVGKKAGGKGKKKA